MPIPSIHPEQNHHSTLLKASSCMSQMENLALWFSKRQNREIPNTLQAAVVLFAADHGVAIANGCNGKRSTLDQVRHAASTDSVIAELCKQAGCNLHIVDVGVTGSLADNDLVEHAKVRSTGTPDITTESAMSQMDYWESVGIGEEMANRAIEQGANLLIASSISAGDRIAIAALISELLGLPPEEALSSTNISPGTYGRELIAVEQALERAQGTPSHDILKELGGIEMAAMAGFYRAAAEKGVPVLLDGLASATAALAAIAWDVRIAGWVLASHVSNDAGHRDVLEDLGLEPLVELKSSIDGGKVATLMLPVLQSAITLQQGLARIEMNSD
ncbi:nicotinate-nucleotide--dimethylbenzimidazole phosphoribosyltransferase [Mariprofundus sp. EBB-1]|uniref:nicotinate-nucleotide--dimethylbenzimidazole phosphoribosyltransferase n=1 Tax=Mariprofundus sp. EBB-1 TaxID=2650971 RepID=UPI000EF21DBA|nr:nicotinate-nucleotide--dimethylbenzimidazole phosphoribosyltransferase [Mariprofundus sp. EBB-1]RLL50029.1 nicotinate-nucleotide--dimethylbenzimidazole phosphoribosyltransferase [Mariprofundus sp. EBB-1]